MTEPTRRELAHEAYKEAVEAVGPCSVTEDGEHDWVLEGPYLLTYGEDVCQECRVVIEWEA